MTTISKGLATRAHEEWEHNQVAPSRQSNHDAWSDRLCGKAGSVRVELILCFEPPIADFVRKKEPRKTVQ